MSENEKTEEMKTQENISSEEKKTDSEVDAKETESTTAEKTEEVVEKTLEEKFADLQNENAELKNQYLRKVADFDNYRKRMIREKQDAFDYANTNLLTDLIGILDDFDRALAVAPQNESAEIVGFVDGVKMINKQLVGMLESKYNLACYGVAGDAFDHDKHEAIGSVQMPVAEPVCSEVYLKGYMLKERVIRPAKVMVHMPDGTVEANAETTDDSEK